MKHKYKCVKKLKKVKVQIGFELSLYRLVLVYIGEVFCRAALLFFLLGQISCPGMVGQ